MRYLFAIVFILAVLLPGVARAAWVVERAVLPDGSTSVWTSVDAVDSPRTAFGTEVPGRLLVGCLRDAEPPGAFGVRLAWRPAVALPDGAVAVRYRIDDAAAAGERWIPMDGGGEVARGGEDHLDLVAALASGATLRIEVAPDETEVLAWRVELTSARPALVRVLAHCAGAAPGGGTVESLAAQIVRGRAERAERLREAQARIREAAETRDRAVAAYAEEARRTIAGYWVPPDASSTTEVRVALVVSRAGRVVSARLETPTDDAALDWSVVNALDKAQEAGLPPLPGEYDGERLEVVVTLEAGGGASR